MLKTQNLSDADRIVILLTPEHGILHAVARNAKKLQNPFGGRLEPFSLISFEAYHKEQNTLLTLRHAELVQSNMAAASEPETLTAAAEMTVLLLENTFPALPENKLFRMTKAVWERIFAEPSDIPYLRIYFKYWLAAIAGVMPNWSECFECRRNLLDDPCEGFADVNGNVRCAACGGRRGIFLSGLSLKILHAIKTKSPNRFAENIDNLSNSDFAEVNLYLERLLTVNLNNHKRAGNTA